MEEQINTARKKIQQGNPKISLVSTCQINQGVHQLSDAEKKSAAEQFDNLKSKMNIYFFVPASGSGSRMFKDLYGFLKKPKQVEFTKAASTLRDQLSKFAFYELFKKQPNFQLDINQTNDEELVAFLLTEKGLNIGHLPKGLIPFHQYSGFSTNPFQEHLIQGAEVAHQKAMFHFTVNKNFEKQISSSINEIKLLQSIANNFEFSEQDPKTDAIAFTNDLAVAKDAQGNMITRPAGHGTLINNLNKINADLILIRNIDNIQHNSKAEQSITTRKWLSGVLLDFQSQVFEILKLIGANKNYKDVLIQLNKKYDLRLSEEIIGHPEKAMEALNKPMRICGMVKNEGAPGGGPFWVANEKGINRQIIEKSQVLDNPEQAPLMEKSTHFNPVELVCAVKDFNGDKFNLIDFVDDSQYFIVQKSHEGQDIQYIEQPGLWNGAMANWLTLFYEINSQCFSPVKTVFDLLKDPHQPV